MPTNEEIYDEAERLKDAGKLEEAAAKLVQLTELDPGYVLGHTALAMLYTKLRRYDEAVRHASKACELEPNDAFNFTALSVTFQRAGKIPEAEEAMAKARMLQGR
jgi:tetratricopeptide (TPR) repeat protein